MYKNWFLYIDNQQRDYEGGVRFLSLHLINVNITIEETYRYSYSIIFIVLQKLNHNQDGAMIVARAK